VKKAPPAVVPDAAVDEFAFSDDDDDGDWGSVALATLSKLASKTKPASKASQPSKKRPRYDSTTGRVAKRKSKDSSKDAVVVLEPRMMRDDRLKNAIAGASVSDMDFAFAKLEVASHVRRCLPAGLCEATPTRYDCAVVCVRMQLVSLLPSFSAPTGMPDLGAKVRCMIESVMLSSRYPRCGPRCRCRL
jgi:hypothetical protein